MTPDASAFVTPLSLSALSGKPVLTHTYNEESGAWNNHVALAEECDAMVIAPLTANTLAKMVTGVCDNLLMACYFSARQKVAVAPAMDLEMYRHPAVNRNLKRLSEDEVYIIPAATGYLASGLQGEGRMEEPENIMAHLQILLASEKDLHGKSVMVNAGPTREYIDPVRYIGNESSGKMGVAIANELRSRGANVQLVLGPVQDQMIFPGIEVHQVCSAHEMAERCIALFEHCDAAILSAAVADFSPVEKAENKIKKGNESEMVINLRKTTDILKTLAENKGNRKLIGFALETDDEWNNARNKLLEKGADVIVLNSLRDKGAGFGVSTNKVSLIDNDNETSYPLMDKTEVARIIVDKLTACLG
jgi:phosphopantothenoylcysteine decarboxylase/phosphopantothenate--cysteine ligase